MILSLSIDRLSFDQLQAVSNRVATLRGRQVNFMRGFYNNKLKCFQHSPTANQRVSISSTSLATMTILKVIPPLLPGLVLPRLPARQALGPRVHCSLNQSGLQDPKMWTGVAGRANNAEICLPDIRRSLAESGCNPPPAVSCGGHKPGVLP